MIYINIVIKNIFFRGIQDLVDMYGFTLAQMLDESHIIQEQISESSIGQYRIVHFERKNTHYVYFLIFDGSKWI